MDEVDRLITERPGMFDGLRRAFAGDAAVEASDRRVARTVAAIAARRVAVNLAMILVAGLVVLGVLGVVIVELCWVIRYVAAGVAP